MYSFVKNKLIIIFFVLIFFVPIFWMARGPVPSEVSIVEARLLEIFPQLSYRDFKTAVKRILQNQTAEARSLFFDQMIDRTFQSRFESASSDQFPGRLDVIQISKTIDRGVIQTAYSLLKDEAIPTDMQTNYYVIRETKALIYEPAIFNKYTKSSIKERVDNYNELISSNPDLNFYLFYYQTLPYSEYHPLNKYFAKADNGKGFQYFLTLKPEGLTISESLLTGLEDHYEYYYRTDHHWNAKGVLRAYDKIQSMLSINYPDISPKMKYEGLHTFSDIKFYGTLARLTYYPSEGEEFVVPILNYPEYKVTVDGKERFVDSSKEYLKGNYSTEKYVNHYGVYYSHNGAIVEYVFKNDLDRNLLIIGDSFVKPLEIMLASHYHQTFVVDFRHETDFSLSKFLQQNHVDDVLVIGGDYLAFIAPSWAINP